MASKRNIDEMFKQQFKNFEATPNDAVWDNIQLKLDEKKSIKFLIFVRIIFLGLIISLVSLSLILIKNNGFNDVDGLGLESNKKLINNSNIKLNKKFRKVNDKKGIYPLDKTSDTNLIVRSFKNKFIQSDFNKSISQINNDKGKYKVKANLKSFSSESNLLEHHKSSNKNSKTIKNDSSVFSSFKTRLFVSKKEIDKKLLSDNIETKKFSDTIVEKINFITDDVSKLDDIEVVELSVDESLEDLISKLKENNLKDIAVKRWSIKSNISPVYYNSLSVGSPINNDLSQNNKKGKITMSYGLGVGYVLSDKLALRTGVNSVSLELETENVFFINDSRSTTKDVSVENINLNQANRSLVISNYNSLVNSQMPVTFIYNSSLNQRIEYIELPFELNYNILDKKIKISLISGFSTFFLDKNELYSEINGVESYIGKANNLNKISYSVNAGIGFNYNISKEFNFNFEPTFKYQLNTYSNNSGGFRPYILGIYTGFSYKF